MANEKTESHKELRFTVLGPSGAGKTTMLACMYNEFEDLRSGMLVPDPKTSKLMQIAYSKLKSSANSPSKEFGTPIEGTEDIREYKFDIKGKNETLSIHFYDFPGAWMDPGHEYYGRIIDIAKQSHAILVAVNTPYVMEEEGLYAEQGISGATIQNIIANSYQGGNKLILLVPIKCEKYTRSVVETKIMRDRLKERGIFKRTVGLMSNPTYKDMTMAILPIHTVGNAEFDRFTKDKDGNVTGEVYKKIPGKRFSPMDTEQPIRFVMSFLLNELARMKAAEVQNAKENPKASLSGAAIGAATGAAIGSFIPFIGTTIGAVVGGLIGAFGGDDDEAMKILQQKEFLELGDFIRQGMKLDDPRFEIIGGRDKLEEIPLSQLEALVNSGKK